MSGIATSMVTSPRYRRHKPPRPCSEAKRTRIIDAPMRHYCGERLVLNNVPDTERHSFREMGVERKDDRTIVAEGSLDLRR